MSAHTVIRRVEWTVGPDCEPGREPDSYAVECAVCLARSPRERDSATARDWIFGHLARHPSHRRYRGITRQPWRAVMTGC
ncbi:hypothetical protein PJ985_00445 [Streptomyces sp. ACA25]|uniref:DUF7848 domain-containing protein n=1 Tax=Streptomyces sp. ACA25 TaxID=3022596 RepID=UPI0023079172|nr:hypothetical protein [Streptomyces sp. ACA25]MDB1086051.1 hypothetical protein [Streptomyces sp. ACA25]